MQSPFSSNSAFGSRSQDSRYNATRYVISRKFMQAFGATFYLRDQQENLVLWGSQKAFKLKEDLRFFTDESKSIELIRISARSIMDFGATYDIFDSQTNQKLASVKRAGLKSSFVRDEWEIRDANDNPVGILLEQNQFLAIVRRFVEYATLFLPQTYELTLGNTPVAHYKQTKNPFSSKLEIDFSADNSGQFDRRVGLSMAMLLEAIEGKQH